MASLQRFIDASLRLTMNPRKCAVARPWERSFLGFTISRRGMCLKVAAKAIDRLKFQVRRQSRRTRGHSIAQVIADLRETLLGWKAYFAVAEVLSPLQDLDKWIRRRLRSYLWKQWGQAGYRELRKRGCLQGLGLEHREIGARPLASEPRPALAYALPARVFRNLGLPALAAR